MTEKWFEKGVLKVFKREKRFKFLMEIDVEYENIYSAEKDLKGQEVYGRH